MTDVAPLLEAAVRTATPLLIAAMGETVSERAGVINIGLEGCIIAGAFAAFAVGAVAPNAGYAAAVAAGLMVGVVMVTFSIAWRRDQIIVGTALTMLSLGVTGTLFRSRDSEAPFVVATQPALRIPILSDIPIVGEALFGQPAITYLALLLVPVTWWFLRKTHLGLSLRAVGEAPAAARAAGINVTVVRTCAVLYGSALGGLAGGALVLSQAGTFAEGMSAGRGFLAIAIVALGRWRAPGVAFSSLVFGGAMALQFVVQALDWRVRYELVLMIPYVLTLVALGAVGRGAAPAMLGRAIDDD
jgi:general nucleoside transport system permease protein